MRTIDQKKEYYPAWNRAQLAMDMGDREQAIAWLEKALAAGEADLCSLNVDPLFDPIRDDPRCQQILHRLNLK
jgi:tetratricopeptide (TPR) repeat protein